ncbi:MAG: cob(I)yrinic acid a,c-diamide adenosyltransferase [Mucilaginibacter polytrichastri]|nr:cob(I)yrinic acid a,c-diamide adenosyltransferase [Mucilaginibacter polytrichastri]
MKIYTKTGDKGQTSLIGGTRVPKSDIRVDCYGTVDELNAFVGLIRSEETDAETDRCLHRIQDRLFVIGALLAADPDRSKMQLPEISAEDISDLEAEMDRMNEILPELKHFILPGGNRAISYCHVARAVCRRAERRIVELEETGKTGADILIYMNRLSDYFFVLARFSGHQKNVGENSWMPAAKTDRK